ncbi:hypothetical protein Pd630_LPD04663 [Rhodococcus opacus PD630]|nr:hypothetical protein Pd630_LPD04663 [Rhodococcus opacus PD630]
MLHWGGSRLGCAAIEGRIHSWLTHLSLLRIETTRPAHTSCHTCRNPRPRVRSDERGRTGSR